MHRSALLLILLVLLTAAPLLAQTSTGRHRSASEPEPERPETAPRTDGDDWFVTLGAGLLTSGDLIRIRTANGGDQTWNPPGGSPFTSSNFVLTLDESVALVAGAGRRLGSRAALRLDFGFGQLPISALARVGETAEVHRWDKLGVVMLGLSAEFRLSRLPSHFFLLAGGALVDVSGSNSDAYDQTRVGLRFGGGYRQRLGGDWSLTGEVRDTVQSLDLADYQPPVPVGVPVPDTRVEDLGPQHLVEIVLMLHGSF